MSRGGPPVKIIISAIFLVGGVYFVYMHSVTTARLRDAEKTAERYRREEETKVSQLQELMKSKDELQEKCDSDRQELVNRFNTCNNQNKMLKNQHDELETDFTRLQQEQQKMQEDHLQQETQRAHEFQQLKQEKELELATLKNQVADLTRQNEQLQNEISSLRTQLQNSQGQLKVDQDAIRTLDFQLQQLKQANVQLQLQQQQQQQQQAVQQQQVVGGAGVGAGGSNVGGLANQGVGVANAGGLANNAAGLVNPVDNANQQAPVVNMNANAGNGGLDLGAGQGQVGVQQGQGLVEQQQQQQQQMMMQQGGGQEMGAGAGAVVPPGQDNAQHQVQAPEVNNNNNPAEQTGNGTQKVSKPPVEVASPTPPDQDRAESVVQQGNPQTGNGTQDVSTPPLEVASLTPPDQDRAENVSQQGSPQAVESQEEQQGNNEQAVVGQDKAQVQPPDLDKDEDAEYDAAEDAAAAAAADDDAAAGPDLQGEKSKGDEGQGHPVPDLQQHVQVQPPQLNEQVNEAKGANAGGVGNDMKDLNNGFHDNRIANEGPVNLQVQEPAIPGQNVHHDVNDKGGDSPNNAIDNMAQQANPKDALPLQPQGQGHQPLHFGRFGRQGPMDDMQGNQVDLGHEGHDGNMKVEVEEDEEEAHYNEEKNGKYQDGDEEDYA